jgi:acyl-CoA thioester hydrolase
MSVLPTYRGYVNSWECDENDHLNVRFFVAKANEGLPFVLAALGCGSAALDRMGARPRVLRQHIRFLREARMATPLVVVSGVARHEVDRLTVYGEVRHSLTGAVHAAIVTELALATAEGRRIAIPELRPEHRCEIPEHGAPRGLAGVAARAPPPRAALAELGFVEIGRGRVGLPECDASGELEPFQYVGRVSDSAVNLMIRSQTEDELARRGYGVEGGAVVEFRIVHHAPLRAGSLFTIQSGLAAVTRKTQHVVHLFWEEESSACVASCDVIAVAMDLRTRKAIEFSDARRARMIAGLLKAWGRDTDPPLTPEHDEERA